MVAAFFLAEPSGDRGDLEEVTFLLDPYLLGCNLLLAATRGLPGRVRRITLHDTRRTCGSLLAALDVHPRIAMAILRHSRIALTMEIYTQVPDKVTRDALRRLGDWLDQDQNQDDEDQGDEASL